MLKTPVLVRATSSPVNTWMNDRLGIPGAVDFCLLFSFFIIFIFIIIIKLFFYFHFFLFDSVLFLLFLYK